MTEKLKYGSKKCVSLKNVDLNTIKDKHILLTSLDA